MNNRFFCKGFSGRAIFLALTVLSGCYRKDIRTLEIRVPQMGSEPCARIVQDIFRGVDGVKEIRIDLPQRRVFVTYDGLKTAIVNLEYHLTNAGFDANDKSARPQARGRLPAECR